MPTGYTSQIKDGITFDKFAMDCARAFGACVLLRDEPGGGECIPERFEPSTFYADAMTTAREELRRLETMTEDDATRAAAAAYAESEAYRLKRLGEAIELRGAYRAMLSSVDAWTPPTPDHEGLKMFMREQIEQSIKFDCSEDYYSKPTQPKSAALWRVERIQEQHRSIARYEEEAGKEVERANGRTEWVRALRESLKQTTGA